MKMRGCEDEKMFYRPPLLEEPCAQTLSGKRGCLRAHVSLREPAGTSLWEPIHASHCVPSVTTTTAGTVTSTLSTSTCYLVLLRTAVILPCARMYMDVPCTAAYYYVLLRRTR